MSDSACDRSDQPNQREPHQSWTSLHAHLHRTLKERQLLAKGQHVLLAVSGGQDSLCLVKLLLDLQPKWGWQLAIAHCNHRWRADADANAAYVQQLAKGWQLPYYQQTAADIATSEAAARSWRYEALTAIAQQHGYTHVVTGHTASDRAETFLYNLMRGSGADGLQALTWTRSLTPAIQLVRPLLTLTRAETGQFCQDSQLQIWDDSTNHDLTYARNRIRQELLPYLQTHFNPQAEHAIAQTAELLQADVEYLEAQAAALLQQAHHPDRPGLNRSLLQQSPLALQRRAVRQFLQQTLPSAPSFDHIEKLVSLITAPNRSQTDPFPGGAIAHVEADWIWLKMQTANSLSRTRIMSNGNYPKAWSRFTTQIHKSDGGVSEELIDNFGQLSRWSARFRLAKSFKSLDLGDAYSGSDTPQLYSAITRIFLVYSSFEIYCHINGLNPSQEAQVKLLQDALLQQETIKVIRNLDPQCAIAKFLFQHLKGKALKQMVQDFIDNKGVEVNVSCLARSVRHVFAHGILTANALGLSPKQFDQVSQIISDFLLDCMDKDFDERIPLNLD